MGGGGKKRRRKRTFRKKVGVKFYDLFLLTEWRQRNFSDVSINLPSDFSEIFEITAYSYFGLFEDVTSSKF